MIINKIIYFIIVILILLNNRIIYSYEIKDVTIEQYNKFYSSSTTCAYNYLILCVETNPGDDCSSITFYLDQTLLNYSPVASNETSKLYKLGYSKNVGLVESTITINSELVLKLYCYPLDYDNIQFKSNGFYNVINAQTLGTSLRGSYEMVGSSLDKSVSLASLTFWNSPSYIYITNYPLSQIFISQYSSATTNINLNSQIYTFYNNGNLKQYDFGPIFKDFYDSIYDIKGYPDLEYLRANELQLLGYEETALIEFKSNNTALKSLIVMNLDGNSIENQISITYGDENSTTYLVPLKAFSALKSYELFFVSSSQFIKFFSLLAKINSYPVEPFPDSDNVVSYRYGLPTCTYSFSASKSIEFHPLKMLTSGLGSIVKAPFGFTSGSKDHYIFKATSLLRPFYFGQTFQSIEAASIIDNSGLNFQVPYQYETIYDSSKILKVLDFEFITIIDEMIVLRLLIDAPYGLKFIQLDSGGIYYANEILVGGDVFYGQYEIIVASTFGVSLKIFDIYHYEIQLKSQSYLFTPEFKMFVVPSFVSNFNMISIYNVSFLYNDIDVTNHRHYNVMYFNFPVSVPKNIVIAMAELGANFLSDPLLQYDSPLAPSKLFYAKYLSNGRFQIEFYVEANHQIGDYLFSLLINSKGDVYSESLDGKLRIKKSGMDYFGPKFKKISKILPISTLDENNSLNEIGWSFLIEDPVNGFSHGFIVIEGSIDKSIYNISLNFKDNAKSGSTVYLGQYDVKINVSYPCVSQNYSITEVWLYDNVKRVSYFQNFPTFKTLGSITNPFIYYLNETLINKIPVSCSSNILPDITPPKLIFFNVSKQVIDVSSKNREVTFTFVASDPESQIKQQRYLNNPSVYLSTTDGRILECRSEFISKADTKVTYSCTISLPYSFGYPDSILLSVYGFINVNGLYSGFSTEDIEDLGFTSLLNTTFESREVILSGHYKMYSSGGDLYLYGKYFGSISKAYITFSDGSTTEINTNFITSSIIMVPNVKATSDPYTVYIETLRGTKTNSLIVNPIVYDYYINQEVPTFPPTLTPVPTNSPALCKGNPVCGGPSNGKCIENQGCVCFSPWVGVDCLSQIIIIDPPINGNSSSPTIEITVPDNNNSSSETTVTYKSLISIIALREINIDGKAIKTFKLDDGNWVSREIEHLTYSFYRLIDNQQNNSQVTPQTTNITVTLKWFTNETIISFANETLTMNPSSMKYTIEISTYPFESLLNSLELVMSASIQSDATDNAICSSREFGETTSGDNSNYIKIQVENHSLYGRFIRRGIIDSAIRTVTNIQLDKFMNPITTTKSIESFIGIQIPNYKTSAIIDPDFSVLVDSYSASSICSSSSRLSTGKIVGIVIGCVALVSIIIISIIYYFKKKYHQKKMMLNFNNKLKNLKNEDL